MGTNPTHITGLLVSMLGVLVFAAAAVASSAGVNYPCPGSAARFTHDSDKQQVLFTSPCATVRDEVLARVNGQTTGVWNDPHNLGNYTLTSASLDQLAFDRSTKKPEVTYTDKVLFTLQEQSSQCMLLACSESQVTSVLDYSTNFCNIRMLFCGSGEGCKYVHTDLQYHVLDVQHSFGATTNISDCFNYNPHTFGSWFGFV